MDRTMNIFFQLLKQSLFQKEEKPLLESADWNRLFQYAVRNKADGIIYTAAMNYARNLLSVEDCNKWKELSLSITLSEARKYAAIHKINEECRKVHLKPVFFKGVLLAKLYPEPLLRYSGDTDIYIYPEDRKCFREILEHLGYELQKEISKEMVPVFWNSLLRHKIEVHYCLWEDYTGPQMKLLESMKLVEKDTLITEKIRDQELWTLNYENHLVYQMFHIIKHFSTKYVSVRYLADVTLFVNAYWDEIDGQAFWKKMESLGYEVFCKTFFELAIEILNMREDALTGSERCQAADKERLLKDMTECGDNQQENNSWQVYSIITPYLQGDVTGVKSPFQRKLNMFFPTPNQLPQWCWYAKKYPILLPVAWIHKITAWLARYLKHKLTAADGEQEAVYGIQEKITAASYRLELMQEMKLF